MTLFVANTDLGRGVYSDQAIAAGALIERAPVIALPPTQVTDLSRTSLHDYWFACGLQGEGAALVAGFGSLYNHASAPNAVYSKDVASAQVEFVAARPIGAGEEIRVDYTGGGDPAVPL
jgi:hypothetical protein